MFYTQIQCAKHSVSDIMIRGIVNTFKLHSARKNIFRGSEVSFVWLGMGEQADSFFVLIIMEASSDLMEGGRELCAERIN